MADIRQISQTPILPEHLTRPTGDQPNISSTSIQVADPNRVTRATNPQMEENEGDQQAALLSRTFDSNFDGFIKALKGTPYISETFVELLFYKTDSIVSSGVKENFAAQLSSFMQLMKMEPEELVEFIKNQSDSSLTFQGPLFDRLRDVLTGTGSAYIPASNDLKAVIGEFLKQYEAYVSRPHIEQNMRTIMGNINDYMISQPKHEFAEMLNLYDGIQDETMAMSYVKNGIIPFISKYISDTRDFGQIRNLVNMLTYNAAKLENSSEEQLEEMFDRLMSYRAVRGDMTRSEISSMKNALLSSKYANSSNKFIDSFVDVIKSGVKGDAGIENRTSFKNVMESMVIDKSVYIPLMHLVVPAEIHGKQFFSELWVDPDADSFFEGKSNSRTVKLLIKFDIKDVGFFETIILNRDDDVAINVYYPESFTPFETNIRNAIGSIMAKNNLNCKDIGLSKSTAPKDISEVFPKIFEKEKVINVTV